MSKAFSVHIVKAIHHLMKVSPRYLLWKLPSFGNEVKELSSSNILQHDRKAIVRYLILLFIDGILPHTDQLHQILMVQLLHDSEFML